MTIIPDPRQRHILVEGGAENNLGVASFGERKPRLLTTGNENFDMVDSVDRDLLPLDCQIQWFGEGSPDPLLNGQGVHYVLSDRESPGVSGDPQMPWPNTQDVI